MALKFANAETFCAPLAFECSTLAMLLMLDVLSLDELLTAPPTFLLFEFACFDVFL